MRFFATSSTGQIYRLLFLLLLFVLCTYWMFIDTYRLNAFDIVPHDDYAPYLLYLVGEDGGRVLRSPFAYRLFSVAVAVPFYFLLPVYRFSRLENIDTEYLRAVEALAMVSYLSILAICVLMYLITTKRLRGSTSAGLIAALGSALLLQFSGYKGIDPVAILLICLLIYFSRNLLIFAILILLSAGFNEKISLIITILMAGRLVLGRDKRVLPYAVLSVVAFSTYLLARVVIDIPGNEHQTEVASFLATAWENFTNLASLKRIVLEVVPVGTIAILCALAVIEFRRAANTYSDYFSIADAGVLLGYVLVLLAVGIEYNTGRLIMFCAPFYLPLAAIYIERMAGSMGSARAAP